MKDNPSDEFDRVSERSSRRGVHRRRIGIAGTGGLALKITVAVLALLILAVAFLLVPRLGLIPGGTAAPGSSVSGLQSRSGTP